MKISNGIEIIETETALMYGKDVINPVLIWDENDMILVDAGMPGFFSTLKSKLDELGLDIENLNKIIVTHADMDHIGGISSIIQNTNHKIEILSSVKEKPYIDGSKLPLRLEQYDKSKDIMPKEQRVKLEQIFEGLRKSYKSFCVNVDRTLDDGEILQCFKGIKVISSPGHTPGHISLYIEKLRLLIGGDLVNLVNNEIEPAPKFTTFDIELSNKSIQKLKKFNIEKIICYHGGFCDVNVNQKINKL